MAQALIDDFKASGAEAMVFEDDIGRQHLINSANTSQTSITTYHLVDIIAKALWAIQNILPLVAATY